MPKSLLVLVGILLIAHLGLALQSVRQQSITVDEIFHITGGFTFNRFQDFRIHPDNGVLPQRIQALPAVMVGAHPPATGVDSNWFHPHVTRVCYQFFYQSGNDHASFLLGARILNLGFSVALVCLVFAWAREIGGDLAALVATALAALSPTLLAHGPVATTDTAAALLLNASAGAFWVHLQRRGLKWAAVSAILFGLACVTKYSAVLLIPVFLMLIVLERAFGLPARRRITFYAGTLALHAIVTFLIIWACFGFRYSLNAPGLPISPEFRATWAEMLPRTGWQAPILQWCQRYELLPEGFLWGYAHTYVGSLARNAFLAGDTSLLGWKSFFPLAFLWKSTPAELAGLLLVVLALVARRLQHLQASILRIAPLLVLGLIYGAMAIMSHLNIGHRHLLPLYPAVFIITGVAIAAVTRHAARIGLVAGIGLVCAQAAVAAGIFPHYLAYFNSFAGGPANGHRLLVDSSLDWGQDLSRVQPWLNQHQPASNPQPVFLSYFGSGEPAYYGITAHRLPFVNGFDLPSPLVRLTPGIYIISATMLSHVYSPIRGPWTMNLEREFQQLRALESLFVDYASNPTRREEIQRSAPSYDWETGSKHYDLLRFARLCHFLRARPIDDHLGYSLHIYRLNEKEIRAATAGSYTEWRDLIDSMTVPK